MKNGFIIVNYNDYDSTKHLVDNIIDYKIIDEIVIVDNNSTDKEKQKLANIKHKKIEIIYNTENNGYSNAINIGSKYLIDKYDQCNLIIANSDIVIMSEEDLKELLDLLNYEKIGLVAPQILERGRILRGWKMTKPLIDYLYSFSFLRDFLSEHFIYYKDDYYEEATSIVDVVSGCFFLITSETMKKINYMDEAIFLYYESSILCQKIHNLGLMVVVDNGVKIKHNYAKSVDKSLSNINKYRHFYESQYYYQTTYNRANKWELFLFKITAKIKYAFLSIYYKIKRK